MPYITKDNREEYDGVLDQLAKIHTKGDLEYCIARLMNVFMKTREQRYANLHDCAYAAQHSCDEFRRRFLDKREDDAIASNGDVYDFLLNGDQ